MKDFYKTLGVSEDASAEEIRERWVELTKQYHPDRTEDLSSDERIREINEAYQVLKHSSTRVEYDLKRAFGQKKKKSYARRFAIPASILAIAIIIGIIYFMNSQNGTSGTDQGVPSPRQPIIASTQPRIAPSTHSRINASTPIPVSASSHPPMAASTHPRIPPSSHSRATAPPRPRVTKKNQTSQKDETDQRNEINERNQRDQTDQPPAREGLWPGGTNQTNQRAHSIVMAATAEKIQLPQPPQNPITPLPNDAIANKPAPSINPKDRTDQINETNLILELTQFKPPSLLATEDEVKKFFNNYIKYYERKDLKGILSLFSSKALQNQKDGLEDIRKSYADFFNEAQRIRFYLQDMKIEIYQNAVEVKARYEIEQTIKASGEREVWKGPIRWVLIKEDGNLKILSVDFKPDRTPLGKKEESDEA